MIHVISTRFSTPAALRALCGKWRPKQTGQACPACQRLEKGGKA